mmetsp:Transcript_63000/g.117161  ORF Transcript_63000/g.117161 Transcript_63000/m.117161 type:complete len:240 (-) Transcript_63000:50-769(-)
MIRFAPASTFSLRYFISFSYMASLQTVTTSFPLSSVATRALFFSDSVREAKPPSTVSIASGWPSGYPAIAMQNQSPCFSRMYLVKSKAQVKPPSVASHFSAPRGGSPLNATRLQTPHVLQSCSAMSTFSFSMFVHVRCMFATQPRSFFAASQRDIVRSEVDPPAPHVKSVKSGCSFFIRSIRFFRFFTPSSVLGGKYSNENQVDFLAAIKSDNMWSFGALRTPGILEGQLRMGAATVWN